MDYMVKGHHDLRVHISKAETVEGHQVGTIVARVGLFLFRDLKKFVFGGDSFRNIRCYFFWVPGVRELLDSWYSHGFEKAHFKKMEVLTT